MSLGGSSDLGIVEGILGRGNIFRIMIAIFYGQIDGAKVEAVTDFIFLGFKVTADSNCSHEIKRCLFLGRKVMTSPRQHIKKQRHHFADKSPYSQCYGFSSNYVWMWDWGHKEGWAPKNWCLQIVVLEKTLESPSDCKEINSVDLKWNQPWIFIRRTDAKAKLQYFGHLMQKERIHLKRPWCWERLKAGGEGDDRGWDGWMASLTQWT